MPPQSIFQDVFETDPLGRRGLFESFRPEEFFTQFQQGVYSDMFDRTLNNFLGTLGAGVRSGNIPEETFTGYLQKQDFGRQYRSGNVFDTGRQTSPFRSAARFLFAR